MEQRITAPNGCKIESVEHDDNSVVIMFSEDKPKFKRGDFLVGKTTEIMVIFKESGQTQGSGFETFYNNWGGNNKNWTLKAFRLCTDKEKQEMLDYMHSNGKDWDEVNMEVTPYVWNPKDGEKYWYIDHDMIVFSRFYSKDCWLDSLNIETFNRFRTIELAEKYAKEFKRILKERKL